VQDGVRKIQAYISSNIDWLGLASNKPQRVLDYACGHGTISLVRVHLLNHEMSTLMIDKGAA
jgi:hypothetical protein